MDKFLTFLFVSLSLNGLKIYFNVVEVVVCPSQRRISSNVQPIASILLATVLLMQCDLFMFPFVFHPSASSAFSSRCTKTIFSALVPSDFTKISSESSLLLLRILLKISSNSSLKFNSLYPASESDLTYSTTQIHQFRNVYIYYIHLWFSCFTLILVSCCFPGLKEVS